MRTASLGLPPILPHPPTQGKGETALLESAAMSFPVSARFARRFRWLVLLRASFILGALYDVGFAVLMVAAPEATARRFRLPLPPLPQGAFYLWILAVLLLMLSALYTLAAHDSRRYSGVVRVAIGGRLLGGAVLFLAAWRQPGLGGLYPLAAADLVFGVAHAAFWWPQRA
jgi:hypothetical protein